MQNLFFYNVFDITAIIILIIIKVLMISQRQIKNPTQRPYLWYMGLSILATSLNIATIYLLNTGNETPNLTILLCNLFYFVFLLQVISVYLYFNKRFNMKRNYRIFYLSIPSITSLLLLATNRITNVIFSISADGAFTYGPLYLVLWISAILFFGDTVYFIYKERYSIQKRKMNLITFCGVFLVLMIFAHYLFPKLQMLQFTNAIFILIIFIERQSPLLLEDLETGSLNSDTFYNYLSTQISNESQILLIHIKNANITNELSTFSFIPTTYLNIVNKTKKRIKRCFIFRVEKNTFAIIMKNEKDKIIASNLWIEEFEKLKETSMAALPIRLFFATTSPLSEFSDRNSIIDAIKWGLKKLNDYNTKLDIYITPDFALKYTRERIIDSEIHKIVNHKPIEFNLQPIYNINKEKIDTAEALARVKIPSLGSVPVIEFINMSEANGTIISIGKAILEEICNVINTINLPIENISVNVSMAHFMEKNIVNDFLDILKNKNVDPSKIILEITETIKPVDSRLLKENMLKLKEAGFKLSLDDFGTGYSTFESLLTLPYDIIKLDRNLLLACENETIKLDILKKVVSMVKSLDFEVILEGVETKRQDEIARKIGVDKIQGYYYSKPLDLAGIVSFFSE